MTKIGLMGDPHARPGPVAEALAVFRRAQVDAVWCTGDIAGYGDDLEQTITLLEEGGCQSILGNHEIWYLEKHTGEVNTKAVHYFNGLPLVLKRHAEGKRLYMVHASPPDSMTAGMRLLDQQGNIIEAERQAWAERLANFEHEVLIVGHTHQVFAVNLGRTLVINPGSTGFNHCCAVLSLPDLQVQWYALGGQAIIKNWNWGLQLRP